MADWTRGWLARLAVFGVALAPLGCTTIVGTWEAGLPKDDLSTMELRPVLTQKVTTVR